MRMVGEQRALVLGQLLEAFAIHSPKRAGANAGHMLGIEALDALVHTVAA
jgi:hypothetical protein